VTNTPTKLVLQLNKFFYKANVAHCSTAAQHTKLLTNYVNYVILDYLSETIDEADFNFLVKTEVRDARHKAICIQINLWIDSNKLVQIIMIFHFCTISSVFKQE